MDDSFLPFAANIGGRQNPIREKPGLSLFLLTWAAEQNSCELLQDANRCPGHVPLPSTNGAFVTIVPRIVSHSSTVSARHDAPGEHEAVSPIRIIEIGATDPAMPLARLNHRSAALQDSDMRHKRFARVSLEKKTRSPRCNLRPMRSPTFDWLIARRGRSTANSRNTNWVNPEQSNAWGPSAPQTYGRPIRLAASSTTSDARVLSARAKTATATTQRVLGSMRRSNFPAGGGSRSGKIRSKTHERNERGLSRRAPEREAEVSCGSANNDRNRRRSSTHEPFRMRALSVVSQLIPTGR